jgi:Carboxypeptidase regulatory-like domain/TonB-dependent Receptor Plug Domain
MKKILPLLVFCIGVFTAFAQNGDITGVVKDTKGEGLYGATVVVLDAQGKSTGVGAASDFDGRFTIKPLSAGKYNLQISSVGYGKQILNQVIVNTDKSTAIQVTLKEEGVTTNVVVVITYKKPIIDSKETKIEQIQTKDDIKNSGNTDVGTIANQTSGVTQTDPNKGITINGAREDEVQYIVNGHRTLTRPNIPVNAIKEISVLTGGISAKYGDVTAGVVSITLNDAQDNFSAGLAARTSKGLDAFGSTLLSADISTPLIRIKDKEKNKRTVIGFSGSFQYSHDDDRDPSAVGVWRAKDDVLNDIRKAPLYKNPFGNNFLQKGEDLTFDKLYKTSAKAFNRENNYSGSGELGIYATKNVSFAVGGTVNFRNYYDYIRTYALLNSENDPLYKSSDIFFYGRFTHRIAAAKSKEGQENKNANKKIAIQNAFYTLQFDYEKYKLGYEDDNHGKNFFNYGYIGQYRTGKADNYTLHTTANPFTYRGKQYAGYVQEGGSRDTGVAFKPGTVNALGAVFTEQYYQLLGASQDADGFYDVKGKTKTGFTQNIDQVAGGGALINGQRSNPLYNLWFNVGRQFNGYGVSNNDESYRGKIEGAFDIVKLGSSNANDKHTIELGVEYEQRIQRIYDVNPLNLWERARTRVNTHLLQDTGSAVFRINGKDYPANSPNIPQFYSRDTILFQQKADLKLQTRFDKELRKNLGLDPNGTQSLDLDNITPDKLNIGLFSADDLISYVPSGGSTSIIHYRGYDYKGNVLTSNPTTQDFFTKKDADGNFTREQSAFMPVYAAGYIQDKFFYKGLGFNVGLRVDQYDANQSVLKDPYSLYEVKKAGDIKNVSPANIGKGYAVYIRENTTDDTKRDIVGYRDPETEKWYDKFGRETTGQRIRSQTANGLLPYLNLPNNAQDSMSQAQAIGYIKRADYDAKSSFTQYKAVWNLMPRIQLAFNISNQAQFFAHYDILTQRPTSRNALQLTDYYFFSEYSAIKNNPNLQPVRKVDYEFGFKQQVAQFASVTVSAFYQEASGLVQLRKIQYAFPSDYSTYDNIDFRTTKGAKLILDMRRYQNFKVSANYTLLFADGTGSDDNSQQFLVNANNPNLRSVYPISTDNRHTFKATLDYRFGNGTDGDNKYTGPRTKKGYEILSDFGVNLTFLARSGGPTRQATLATPEASISGAGRSATNSLDNRLPWYFRADMRINKDFDLALGKKKEGKQEPRRVHLSVYLFVQNLFNTQNIIDLYAYTSNANDDGYLTDANSQAAINANRNVQAYRDSYKAKVNDPTNYGTPRRIYLGANITF